MLQISALEEDIIEVDPETKEMLKMLVHNVVHATSDMNYSLSLPPSSRTLAISPTSRSPSLNPPSTLADENFCLYILA